MAAKERWIRYFDRPYLLTTDAEHQAAVDALDGLAVGVKSAVITAHAVDGQNKAVRPVRLLVAPGADVVLLS